MHLKQKQEIIHLSHLHNYVSAYETNKETVEDLAEDIKRAIIEAKKSGNSIIVHQDCLDHISVVYPSGTIFLYRAVGRYEVDNG